MYKCKFKICFVHMFPNMSLFWLLAINPAMHWNHKSVISRVHLAKFHPEVFAATFGIASPVSIAVLMTFMEVQV